MAARICGSEGFDSDDTLYQIYSAMKLFFFTDAPAVGAIIKKRKMFEPVTLCTWAILKSAILYLRVVEFAVLLSLSIQSVFKVLLTLIVPKVLCDTKIRYIVRFASLLYELSLEQNCLHRVE